MPRRGMGLQPRARPWVWGRHLPPFPSAPKGRNIFRQPMAPGVAPPRGRAIRPLVSPPPRSIRFPRYPFPKGARRSSGVDAPKGHGIAAHGEALGLGASPTPIPPSPEGAQHFPQPHAPGWARPQGGLIPVFFSQHLQGSFQHSGSGIHPVALSDRLRLGSALAEPQPP